MVASSIVSVANLENSLDFSPEYYRPEWLRLSKRLHEHPFSKMGSFANITDGEHGSPDWDINSGIRYIAAEHILANALSNAPMRTISAAQDVRNARSRVQKNDILVYSVGAYAGLAARAEPHLFPANIPRSVAIIRLKPGAPFRAGFVTVFLNTEYGQFQTRRLRAGNSQPVLALEKIRQIELPQIPIDLQDKVDQLYESAYQARLSAQRSYLRAKELLETELGLNKLTFQKMVGYTASFNELQMSRRFDPEHYSPLFRAFKDALPVGITLSPLSNYLYFCNRGKQPIYSNAGIPVINSKHVQENRIIFEGNRVALHNSETDLQIRYGDTLLNGTGRGTIGRSAPYLIDEPAIPDNHVTILRSDNLDPVFLSLYLNSAAGQMQVEMHQRGTSGQLELYPHDIRKFLIWPAPETFQKTLRKIHETAYAAELESKKYLEQAKTHVEQLIEEVFHGSDR